MLSVRMIYILDAPLTSFSTVFPKLKWFAHRFLCRILHSLHNLVWNHIFTSFVFDFRLFCFIWNTINAQDFIFHNFQKSILFPICSQQFFQSWSYLCLGFWEEYFIHYTISVEPIFLLYLHPIFVFSVLSKAAGTRKRVLFL